MRKNGFTLVELLAIIIIISIITLITIPIFNDIIEKTRISAAKESAMSYISGLKNALAANSISKAQDQLSEETKYHIDVLNNYVKIKGNSPVGDEDYLIFDKNFEITEGVLTISNYEMIIENGKISSIESILFLQPTKPVITQFSVNYPVITEDDVISPGEISIDFSKKDRITNYYSLDNGVSWLEYDGNIVVTKNTTVLAKSVSRTGVESEYSSLYVDATISDTAIPRSAYDKDNSTQFTGATGCSKTKYMLIDEKMQGKKIDVYQKTWNGAQINTFNFYDLNDVKISGVSYQTSTTATASITIPINAVKMGVIMSGAYCGSTNVIYEISIDNSPTSTMEQLYPVIKLTGIENGYNNIELKYFNSAIQRIYKIDDGEWLEYKDEKIKLNIGQKIEAKSIDKNGIESKLYSYTSTLIADGVPGTAYDGTNSTQFNGTIGCSKTKYILIDETMRGKIIKVYQRTWNGAQINTFNFYDLNGLKISGVAYQTSSTTTASITIPINTIKMGIYMSGAYCNSTNIIYEITVA